MRYLPYEKYKTAKTDLIGEIPDHWEEWKASHGFGQIGSGTTPKSDNSSYYGGETLWVTTSELRETYVFDTAIKVTDEALADHSALKQYPIDSVLIAMYGATIGRLGMLGKSAAVNQACCVYAQPEKFHPRFFYFWLWMRRPILISLSSGGGQPNLNQEELKRIRIPIPPLGEQEQIAAFLDWKTGQIDALIAKKQALIEKLKEKRLAVITQAVTKGLDPSVPLRDSGISWLGKVPKHWQQKRLKWAIMFQRGHDLPAEERNHGEVPLVSSSGISALHDVAIARGPGIVTGRYGTIGVFHLVEEDYWPLNTTLYSIDLYDNNPRFLCSLLENLSPLFLLNAKKSAVPGVDRNDLHAIPVVLPEIEEQNEIADYLQIEEQKYLAMKARVEEAITRLTEYRTALITAATTGQIDVRKVAIPAQA